MLTALRSSWLAATAPRVAPLLDGPPHRASPVAPLPDGPPRAVAVRSVESPAGESPRRVAGDCERPARRGALDAGAARRRDPLRHG